MIMKCKITRLISLFMMVFTISLPSYAGGGDKSNYYSKVIANAFGEGKVYASKSSTQNPLYQTGSSVATNSSEDSSAPSHTYYVYAKADTGYEFAGWYLNSQCTGETVSASPSYSFSVKAESTTQASPTTTNIYAKFVKVGMPKLKYGTAHAYVNLSTGTYKNETLTTENVTDAIIYESSNENVATVAADGTVTVKKNGSCYIKAKSGEGEGSYILTVIDDVAAGNTQIGNGDFEDWRGVTGDNHAPNNWNSFETGEGSLIDYAKGQAVSMKEGGRPGSDGLYCADIYSRKVTVQIVITITKDAQGNLTTGCIYAGSATADGKENYNYSKTSDPAKSETISKIPSKIRFWAKFVPAKVNNSYPNALMEAVVHDDFNYITYCKSEYESDEEKSHVMARAREEFPSTNDEWHEFTVDFKKTGNTPNGQLYIMVNFATNAVPAQGQEGDHLYIDDVELVYDEPEPIIYNEYISIAHTEPVQAPIEVTFNDDKTIDFNLKNFSLGTLNVGNINVLGLAIDDDGNFSFDGNIQITAGDKEGVDTWVGPTLGDIPVVLNGTIKDPYFYVHLDINIPGTPVEVEVGDKASATLNVSDALIGTFCAPFTVAIPSEYQSYVTVSKVTGANSNNVLTLDPIDNGVIPAHTPVIVEIPMAYSLPVSGIYVKGSPVAGLLTGVYENTSAPVGSYVLQNNNDKVGFYQVAAGKQPTVNANRCYLTAPVPKVKAFYFNEEDATGIENLNVNDNLNEGVEAIYNVAGQRINKLQKGINIINGKKILK